MAEPTPGATRGTRLRQALIVCLSGVVLVLAALMLVRGPSAGASPPTKPKKHATPDLRLEPLGPEYDALKPLAMALPPATPGDWLYEHFEAGQFASEYLTSSPRRPGDGRRTIYLQPIGTFDETQQRLIDDTVRWTEAFFGLPVKLLPPIALSEVPKKARRVHPRWGVKQLDARWLLYDLLKPRIPDDAMALLGLSAMDLFPEPDWNFVFGMASYRDGVGVWSIARFGDPTLSPEAYRKTLEHTLATATHEIFHMYSVPHCIGWECLENGSNSLIESAGRPIHLCPACLKKLCWNSGCDLDGRFAKLEALASELGIEHEAHYYRKARAKLAALKAPSPVSEKP